MSWRAHHRESELIASEADVAKRAGNDARARALYRRAAEEERKALAELDPAKRRTFGITTVGIASLYFQGNLLDEAEQTACEFIASDLNSDFGRNELRTLLASIYALREYDPVYAEEEPGQISISMRGGRIERGAAPAHLVGRTIKTLESFLHRTAEYVEGHPFHKGPYTTKDIRDRYVPWVRQLAPGSFRFAVGLHAPQQALTLDDGSTRPETISATVLDIVGAATDDTSDRLAQIVSSELHLLKFLRLTRDLAPTESAGFKRLALRGWNDRTPMTLSKDSRRVLNQNIRAVNKAGRKSGEEEIEIRGVLRGVDLEQDWLKVADGGTVKVIQKAGDAIDDLVGAMVNQHVKVLANQTQRGQLHFVDIQPNE